MNWQHHIDFDRCEPSPKHEANSPNATDPGLTQTYDQDLREKASVRDTPIPAAYLGLEGEYDRYGLVKRVASALDDQKPLDDLDTLTLAQKGSSIAIWGQVPDQPTLEFLVEAVSKVDGTQAVDVSGVEVSQA